MPVYDYDCAGCGPFTMMRPMAEFDKPASCPDCGGHAPRVLLSVPHFASMDPARRTAHATNERSANAPRRSNGRHSPGCSCCGTQGKTKLSADAPAAAKAFPSKRPWMISH